MRNKWLIPLYAAVAPFAAWAIEQMVAWPFVVEEVLKGILVWFGEFSKFFDQIII